jgi:tripartite-type tricarboxylate transporter receptor subunit TctC
MKTKLSNTVAASLAALLGTGFSDAALAQGAAEYPARPVTIILPYVPGGTTDIEARLYNEKLQASLKQPFLVDFKPGAGTTIGAAYVAKSAPDGYTLLMNTASFTVAPALYGDKSPYDAIRDFAPVSITTMTPNFMLVNNNIPVRTMKEYLAHIRANPGKVNFGTSGIGGINHLAGAWMHNITNTKVTFIHYKGGNDTLRTLVSGETDAAYAPPLTALPYVKSGKLKALAITTGERVRILPDYPTIVEEGIPGYEWSQWVGVFAPARTPAAIVNKLGAEFGKAAKQPDVIQKLEQGKVVVGSTPEELRRLVAREVPAWKKIIQDTGIKMEE